jgi:hypothetical protein
VAGENHSVGVGLCSFYRTRYKVNLAFAAGPFATARGGKVKAVLAKHVQQQGSFVGINDFIFWKYGNLMLHSALPINSIYFDYITNLCFLQEQKQESAILLYFSKYFSNFFSN